MICGAMFLYVVIDLNILRFGSPSRLVFSGERPPPLIFIAIHKQLLRTFVELPFPNALVIGQSKLDFG